MAELGLTGRSSIRRDIPFLREFSVGDVLEYDGIEVEIIGFQEGTPRLQLVKGDEVPESLENTITIEIRCPNPDFAPQMGVLREVGKTVAHVRKATGAVEKVDVGDLPQETLVWQSTVSVGKFIGLGSILRDRAFILKNPNVRYGRGFVQKPIY
ncbi:MAG: hypothetical protein UT33_C0018G0023 [Candidatus Peregrinibacteria bacterium GW2011_GWC2_39_14]|nr:MAG: hypothetical protein US92_C0003G0006 [Candidatus Peregrinibacteria bacterium GW2011_GWA2_38_36]KKR04671.1 MAG: hypothetical protein UT33_C0018G0023 [Candidatus Peregrinibacteria bacterium GW2011_GWC2_39_14]